MHRPRWRNGRFQKYREADEELSRFGRLVGVVVVFEFLVLFIVWSHFGFVLRPLS